MDAMRGDVKLQIEGVKKEIYSLEKVQRLRQNLAILQEQAFVGKNCHIHNGAVISNSIIGDNCEILPVSLSEIPSFGGILKLGLALKLTLDVVGNNCVINDDVVILENVSSVIRVQ